MHSLTIWFGPASANVVLLYKEEERAKACFALLIQANGALATTDDFGQQIFFLGTEVRGLLLEDMALSQEAAIERGLHQARSQAKAQKLAMTDPIISASLRQQQMGPAVLGPGMMLNGRGMV
jgi:hypothetical protein